MPLAVGVSVALPVSHMQWGATYPGDGQQAMGLMMIFMAISAAAALVFFALGSLGQVLLRERAARYTALCDLALFLAFSGLLIYGGITASYQE